jgi:hypothetical protein
MGVRVVKRSMTSLLLLAVVAVAALGGGDIVDPSLGIPVFLKILTYDANFDAKKSETVDIYVVYDQKTARSYEQLAETEKFFRKNRGLTVDGVKTKLRAVPFDQLDSSLKDVSTADYSMLIVTEIGEERARVVAGKTRAKGIRSFALDPAYIPLGLSITVRTERKNKPILVNLEASRQEGSRFSAHLLKMCEIYEGTD